MFKNVFSEFIKKKIERRKRSKPDILLSIVFLHRERRGRNSIVRLLLSIVFLHRKGEAGVIVYALDDTYISLSFKLEFFSSNNDAEHEALIIRLTLAMQMGMRRLCV